MERLPSNQKHSCSCEMLLLQPVSPARLHRCHFRHWRSRRKLASRVETGRACSSSRPGGSGCLLGQVDLLCQDSMLGNKRLSCDLGRISQCNYTVTVFLLIWGWQTHFFQEAGICHKARLSQLYALQLGKIMGNAVFSSRASSPWFRFNSSQWIRWIRKWFLPCL